MVPDLVCDITLAMIISTILIVKSVVFWTDMLIAIWSNKWIKEKAMTLAEWIISNIQADTLLRKRSRKYKNKTRHCRKYIARRKKGHGTRIATKTSKCRLRVYTACPAETDGFGPEPPMSFDTDSFVIGIDNHASRCIGNNINHFVTPLEKPPQTRCKIRWRTREQIIGSPR